MRMNRTPGSLSWAACAISVTPTPATRTAVDDLVQFRVDGRAPSRWPCEVRGPCAEAGRVRRSPFAEGFRRLARSTPTACADGLRAVADHHHGCLHGGYVRLAFPPACVDEGAGDVVGGGVAQQVLDGGG